MNTSLHIPAEAESLNELISDCADIPQELRRRREATPRPPAPRSWTVDEGTHAQVADLDEFA
ncbi:hypothetical protein ORV05_05615 [Amycolatopsis cynarae]|uniref:Uncharacterized protein n=1 Tax=Amycolatopsis cynarae TaxID=2995223 RepID=A0ABY7B4L5_9PSEU|nr:hypothetical protein [Amycolatopsis sp. HUAS 11-8]WAL67264.1 hypothetical protein ORV05_05615 [Amycolatopsis sp. HUAS 11-8]